MRASRHERGFALVGAVFALVIIAALIAGAFFASRQENTVGRNTQTYQRSFGAAEAGMATTVANWQTGTFNGLNVGDSSSASGTLPGNGGSYSAVVKRLDNQLFLIRTTGTDPSGKGSRTLATLAKLNLIQMNFAASLTTRNSLKIGGSSLIDGRNTAPSGWGCPPVTDTIPGITTRDSSQITRSGCNNWNCVIGKPDVKSDTSINDSTFFKYGNQTWNDLIAMATINYSSGSIGHDSLANGTCDTGNSGNWGEPLRGAGTVAPCYNYFPIIYINGSAHFTGGAGQGILLVEGDLDVTGQFAFYGPVIVRGHLTTSGQGGHFNGGVMSADVDLGQTSILGNAVMTYSSCAITSALQGNSNGRQINSRSWAEITQ